MSRFAKLVLFFIAVLAPPMFSAQATAEAAPQTGALFAVPAKDIELGAPGVLWSVLQTHIAHKLSLSTGAILDTIDLGIPLGNNGRGVAWDGTQLWYSEWDADTLYELNPADGSIVQKFPSPGGGPQGLAWDGTHLWHTDEYTDLIYRIDPATGTVVSTLPSPAPSTWFVGIAYNDGFLYLYSFLTQTIYRVRASDGMLMGTYGLSFTEAGGDITADAENIYIAADGNILTRIPYTVFPPVQVVVPGRDIELGAPGELWSVLQTHIAHKLSLSTGAILDTIDLGIPLGNNGRGVAWDGTHLWYSEWDADTLYELNPADGSIVQKFPSPGGGPQGLAWDGTHLWHTDEYTDLIYKIDPATGTVVSTLPSPAPSTWFVGIAYNDGFLYLYSFLTQTIYRVRASDGMLMGTYGLSFTEAGGDITADAENVYIAADGNVLTRIPYTVFPPVQVVVPGRDIELGAPGELWSVLQTHIAHKLSLSTGAILDTIDLGIPLGNNGRGVAWDGTHLWYSEWDFDKIYKLNPVDGSIVQQYNSPGSGPQGLAWDGTHLWHTDEYTDLIYKIDPATGTVVSTLPSPAPSTWFVGIAYNDGFLYLYSFLTQTIYRVRASDGMLMGTYGLGFTTAGFDITANAENIYIAADGNIVTAIPLGIITEVGEPTSGLPMTVALLQNYPNPFNPVTTVSYALPRQSHAVLTVYSVLGQRVKTLVDEIQGAGARSVQWHGDDDTGRPVSSGVYLYRLEAAGVSQARKMLLLR